VSPTAFLATAFLLGALVLLAGAYGLLYALGRARAREALVRAGYASYAVLAAVAAVIVVATPLGWGWKALVAASSVAYFAIPRLAWSYLDALHRTQEST
jgi:hypothetical protein